MREYRLLGPFEVEVDGQPLDLAAKPRALLAALVLQCGRVVPAGRLATAVWEESPPAGAETTLRTYVSKLRNRVGCDISAEAGGYRLALGDDRRDSDTFAASIAAAESAVDAGRAVTALERALSLWRGPALADLADRDVFRGAAERLDEQRAAVTHQLLELRLQVGDADIVVEETAALLAEDPLREPLHALRMRALYRAGRQADALAAFQRARDILDAELGIEPGPALQELQQAMLRQDPSLDATGGAARPAAPDVRRVPAPVNDIVGRDHDVTAVLDLLSEHRLVSIVGPGGIGKTRLAIEVAHHVPGTAVFVPLASVTEQGLLADIVADEAGAARLPGTDPVTALMHQLDGGPAVLVLDNCEHLSPAAGRFAHELLQRLPQLRILTTTRELLDVAGEALVRLDPLAITDAIDLFSRRAIAVRRDLTLDEAMLGAVVDTLDRLPLAIELAASRLRGMTLAELHEDLREHLADLGRARPGAEPRHQTLAAAIAWSEALLTPEDCRAFRALSAFVAPFTAADATSLLGSDARAVLTSLHDRSLLTRRDAPDGGRFVMFATLRQYAKDQLAQQSRLSDSLDALLGWAAQLSESAAAGLDGPEQQQWLQRVEDALPNVRAALSWALEGSNAVTGLAVAARLYRWWFTRGAGEGLRWLRHLLARADAAPAVLRAKALYALGSLQQVTGAFAEAAQTLRASLALYDDLDDPRGEAYARHYLGRAVWDAVPPGEVRDLFATSLVTLEALGDPVGIGLNHLLLSVWEADHGTVDQALDHVRRCATVFDAIGAPHFMAHSRDIEAVMHARKGAAGQAAALAIEGLELYDRVGNLQCLTHALENAAHTLALLHDDEAAAEVLGVAMAMRAEVHIPIPPYERLFHDSTMAAIVGALGAERAEAAITVGRSQRPDVAAVMDRLRRHLATATA